MKIGLRETEIQTVTSVLGFALGALAVAALSGCDARMAQPGGGVKTLAVPSEMKTSMTVSSPNIADGTSITTIVLTIRDDDGTPIPDATLPLDINGSGNTLLPCTESDSAGQSTCLLRSTIAETKLVRVRHWMSCKAHVDFVYPPSKPTVFGVSSLSMVQQAPNGQKIALAIGTLVDEAAVKDLTSNVRVRNSQVGVLAHE